MIKLLYVGTFIKRKNIFRMIDALSLLKIDFHLTIVNRTSNDIDKVKQYLDYFNIVDNVTFKINLSFEDLKKEYKNADLILHLTLIEGFGLPLIEAMSLGTPVLTSDLPIHKEITMEHQAYADPYSVNEITKKIEELTKDKKHRKEMSKQGKIDSKNYSIKKYIKEIKEVIQ